MLKTVNLIVCAAIACFTFIMVVYKAWSCSFTHDEAYSFLNYASMSSIDILSFKRPYTNSHILNTLLMKWSSNIFGDSELSLRLPNVLSFIPYLYFSYHLLKQLKNQWLLIPAFVLMVANPFLLDFFSLSRGYGLAISLIITSMYFYAKYLSQKKWKYHAFSLIFGGLSVLANFTSLYFLTMLLSLHFIITIVSYYWDDEKKERSFTKHFWLKNRTTLVFIIIYSLVMFEPFRRLAKLTIDFGGTTGIWKDTVMSLIDETNYGNSNYLLGLTWQVLIIITIIGSISFWIFNLFTKKKKALFSNVLFFYVQGIFAGIIIQCILLHHLNATPYLTDRMAIFLAPLFLLSFVLLIDQIKFKITAIPIFIFSTLLLLHTVTSFNIPYYRFWSYEANNREMLSRLKIEHDKTNKPQIQLGISWYFEPSLNYYRIKNELSWLKPLNRKRLQPADDYCYILWEDSAWVNNNSKYLLIESYPISSTSLYKVVQ